MRFAFFTACAVVATLAIAPAQAASESGSFSVGVTVENACVMDDSARLQVHCSTQTPYAVSVTTVHTLAPAGARAITSDAGFTVNTITY